MPSLKRKKADGTFETVSSTFPVSVPIELVDANLTQLDITANGEYTPQSPYNGFSRINVNVPSGGLPDVIKAGDTPLLLSSVMVDTINRTSMTDTGIEVEIKKTGTYRFKCSGARTSTSGTFTVQLYKNNSAISGATMVWSSREGSLTRDIQCNVGDVITVYARSGSTSNYSIVGQLVACIEWDLEG